MNENKFNGEGKIDGILASDFWLEQAEKERQRVVREYTTVTSPDELDREFRAYDFRARLATRLASKFVDRLFQGQDLIVTSDTANAVFDKLADAFMELEDNVLIDLVYDTGGEQGEDISLPDDYVAATTRGKAT